MLIFLFAVFDCKGTEKIADMQVIVCEMMIYWYDLYKKLLLHFLGIGVLKVRRPEGVRSIALLHGGIRQSIREGKRMAILIKVLLYALY